MSALRRMLERRRPFVVAEIGVNHDGQAGRARELVEMAARAGAHAVKFQAFKAERLVRADAPLARYQARNLGGDPGGQLAMLRRLEISSSTLAECRALARERSLAFGVTPFDERSLAEILLLEPDFVKIGSGDADNLPLLEAARDCGRPVLVSTGMCTHEEAARVARWFRPHQERLALLHCVSAYPASEADCNLAVLAHLRELGCVTGFSDHTTGHRAAALATALGAEILERHITLDRATPGPDHACSSDEAGFREWLAEVRLARAVLGDGLKRCMPGEEDVRQVARKSLVLARDVRAGGRLAREDVACLRPADGLPPWRLAELLGRTAARDLPAGGRLDPQDWRVEP
jgi:N,N'-diacetyllegionaminate synthase